MVMQRLSGTPFRAGPAFTNKKSNYPLDQSTRSKDIAPGWESFSMSGLIRRFATDENAATSIEHALIGSFLSVAIVVGAMALGVAVNSTLQGIAVDHLAAPAR